MLRLYEDAASARTWHACLQFVLTLHDLCVRAPTVAFMNPPSPAIVAQNAVRSLPRWIMLLLCSAYVLAGFVGRDPWRDVDMTAFGYMQAMAAGHTSWWHPALDGVAPAAPGLFQYWLGAWALQLMPAGISADMVVRLPFMALLAVTLLSTWWAIYSLARMPGAQPVAFAFGGEASPNDYARAIADGGLLALLACLGLAQMSHETSHTLVQLSATCSIFFAAAAMWAKPKAAASAALVGMLAMTLAGAPSMAMLLGAGAVAMCLWVRSPQLPHRFSWAAWWLLSMAVAGLAAWVLGLWDYRLINPLQEGKQWQSIARLLMWFSWPTWPFAVWTLWRWRKQLIRPSSNMHLAWPVWIWALAFFSTLFTFDADRALILALPSIAALAAFALPTLKRSLGALIDWLTLFFFSISAITIWVVWISIQTGWPAKPAANVARLAVGFVPSFDIFPFVVAALATIAWFLLVAWRTRRHRAAIWKSLAVPAGGTALGWLLLMTLWLPMLDYGRSFAPHIARVAQAIASDKPCVQLMGLTQAQVFAFKFHTDWQLKAVSAPDAQGSCQWLIATPQAWSAMDSHAVAPWTLEAQVTRPTERNDHLLVLHRAP